MATANVIVKFGPGNVKEVEVPQGTTIRQVISLPAIKGGLGLGEPERYDAYVMGVNVPLDRVAPPESVVSLQSRQCTKNN